MNKKTEVSTDIKFGEFPKLPQSFSSKVKIQKIWLSQIAGFLNNIWFFLSSSVLKCSKDRSDVWAGCFWRGRIPQYSIENVAWRTRQKRRRSGRSKQS